MSFDPARHGRWRIYCEPPPIPSWGGDWQFVHDDYDGAPDAHDSRCGSAASVADAILQIRELEERDAAWAAPKRRKGPLG